MKSLGVISLLLPTLVLASLSSGEAQVRQVLQPNQLCSDYPDYAIATFENADLDGAIRAALSVGAEEDLTCGLISRLTALNANIAGIESLVGIQNLTSLTELFLANNQITDIGALSGLASLRELLLRSNQITDISPLSALTSLTFLDLTDNSITDISPLRGLMSLTGLNLGATSITDISALSGLTSLTGLFLLYNSVTDISALSALTSLTTLWLQSNSNLSNIQPLLDNLGLGVDDEVDLTSTSVSCTDIAALRDKGVTVTSLCS